MRRLIKFIYKLGLLVISLTIIFVIYSQTGWFKKNLRELILKNAPTYLNGELRLGPVAGNFFTGIEINNVSLADSTGVVFSAEMI